MVEQSHAIFAGQTRAPDSPGKLWCGVETTYDKKLKYGVFATEANAAYSTIEELYGFKISSQGSR